MGLGHKVAVMVRLIGGAVNEGNRPWSYWPAETTILVKATAPEAYASRTIRAAARQSNLWLQH